MKRKTPEEKQFISDLRAVLKKMPKHLCLITPTWETEINVLRKDDFSVWKNGRPKTDALDSAALIGSVKVDARHDHGWYYGPPNREYKQPQSN